MAWINPATGKRTDPQCAGARQAPVVAGSLSADSECCLWQGVEGMLGLVGQPVPAPIAAPAAVATPIQD
jgi:penicillin-binding protein 1B